MMNGLAPGVSLPAAPVWPRIAPLIGGRGRQK